MVIILTLALLIITPLALIITLSNYKSSWAQGEAVSLFLAAAVPVRDIARVFNGMIN